MAVDGSPTSTEASFSLLQHIGDGHNHRRVPPAAIPYPSEHQLNAGSVYPKDIFRPTTALILEARRLQLVAPPGQYHTPKPQGRSCCHPPQLRAPVLNRRGPPAEHRSGRPRSTTTNKAYLATTTTSGTSASAPTPKKRPEHEHPSDADCATSTSTWLLFAAIGETVRRRRGRTQWTVLMLRIRIAVNT